jgi:hypothetical protein
MNPGVLPVSRMGAFAKRCAVFLLAFMLLPVLRAQDKPGQVESTAATHPSIPTFSFSFERVGVSVPAFILVVAQDGTGRYAGTEVAPSVRAFDPVPPAQPFGREFIVSSATAKKIADLAHALHSFTVPCASKAKNIADTGKKQLTYLGPDGQSSCTYNYSDNKDVQTLTDLFLALAETMDQGRRLDFLRRYDRLGLDDALSFLAQEVSDGRALEIGTIAPSLRSIADDEEVMQRARTRASTLLAQVPAASQPR